MELASKDSMRVWVLTSIFLFTNFAKGAPRCSHLFSSVFNSDQLSVQQAGYVSSANYSGDMRLGTIWTQLNWQPFNGIVQVLERYHDFTPSAKDNHTKNIRTFMATLMPFTYDMYIQRGLKRVSFDSTSFLRRLQQEDNNSADHNTMSVGMYWGSELNATAKVTFRYLDSSELLPLEKKLPLANVSLNKLLSSKNDVLAEVGRLAKSPKSEIQLSHIFSIISHSLYQSRLLKGYVVGHAARSQTEVYRKLGFEILLDEKALGKDQFIVIMPISEFLERYPPPFNRYLLPAVYQFMDELFFGGYEFRTIENP